jgi:hypothetical protein
MDVKEIIMNRKFNKVEYKTVLRTVFNRIGHQARLVWDVSFADRYGVTSPSSGYSVKKRRK